MDSNCFILVFAKDKQERERETGKEGGGERKRGKTTGKERKRKREGGRKVGGREAGRNVKNYLWCINSNVFFKE